MQSCGMAHSLATHPSHRMVLRAGFSDPESQSVATSSDQVQSYKKYLHSLLLELQFTEEPLKDDIVTPPEACHIWAQTWTIRAKYFFLVSSLAGLGAPLTKEEQIVVLRRQAEVRHHAAQVSHTIFGASRVGPSCFVLVIHAAYNVAIEYLSPVTCAICGARSSSRETSVAVAEIQENNNNLELPDAYPMCNVDSSAEESTVRLVQQYAHDPSLAMDQPENLETEPSSVKDGVAAAGVGDGVVQSSALRNEGYSSGVGCSTVKASRSCRASAGYCHGALVQTQERMV